MENRFRFIRDEHMVDAYRVCYISASGKLSEPLTNIVYPVRLLIGLTASSVLISLISFPVLSHFTSYKSNTRYKGSLLYEHEV